MLQVGRRCMIIAPGNYIVLSMTHNPLLNKTYWEGKPVCGASRWLERPLKENCGLEAQLWVKDFGLTQQQVLFHIVGKSLQKCLICLNCHFPKKKISLVCIAGFLSMYWNLPFESKQFYKI